MTQKNKWGGYRPGSGQKPKWKSGKTKAIRVPAKFVDDVLLYARLLDGDNQVQEFLSCELPAALENVQNQAQIRELVTRWQQKAARTSNPKWYYTKRLLLELQAIL